MGKIDMRLKVTKIESSEVKKVGKYYERTLDFYNGDICITSITIKAEKRVFLIVAN